jgi:hypothetical protein
MKARKEFVNIKRDTWYNDNNIASLAPFRYDDETETLWIHIDQYIAWSRSGIIDLIKNKYPLTKSLVPGSVMLSGLDNTTSFGDQPDWYRYVYWIAMTASNPKYWYEAVPRAHVIPAHYSEEHRFGPGLELMHSIQRLIDQDPDQKAVGWFVKCTTCSTKANFAPAPVYSGAEAVCQLLDSDKVTNAFLLGRADNILLRPWDPRINDDNEIRVFVRNGIVTGVSQQACYSLVTILPMLDADDVIKACQLLYQNIYRIYKKLWYQCTFDAFITTDTDGNLEAHLIEINSDSFGWGPAGASLFSWLYRPPPLVDEPAMYLLAQATSHEK